MTAEVILETHLDGLELIHRGKVRDLYAVGDDILIVATDRISAFDCVLPTGIPRKGEVLTALTLFWLTLLDRVTENHLLTADVTRMGPQVKPYAAVLQGRSMLARKAKVMPVECVARGYLAGSGWKEYRERGTVCGISLPPGLKESDCLPEPIFTPTTKAASGHDLPMTYAEVEQAVGREMAAALRARSLAVYESARDYAHACGIIIADTKFEWGLINDKLVLVDEALTPDSSRFWPLSSYVPGRPQPSYDKQFVRDYLETLDWNKRPPAPPLPEDVVQRTSAKYIEACRLLTASIP